MARWAVPQDEPVEATEGNGATGIQKSDSNQYGVTIGSETAQFAYELTADAIAALLAAVSGGN